MATVGFMKKLDFLCSSDWDDFCIDQFVLICIKSFMKELDFLRSSDWDDFCTDQFVEKGFMKTQVPFNLYSTFIRHIGSIQALVFLCFLLEEETLINEERHSSPSGPLLDKSNCWARFTPRNPYIIRKDRFKDKTKKNTCTRNFYSINVQNPNTRSLSLEKKSFA